MNVECKWISLAEKGHGEVPLESRRYSKSNCFRMVTIINTEKRDKLTGIRNDHPLMTRLHISNRLFANNWLRVLGAAEMPDIDHGVGHQFHRIVPMLDALKPHQ